MSLLDRVRDCADFDPGRYVPFSAAGLQVGRIGRGFVANLERFPDVFDIGSAGVALSGTLSDFAARTAAMAGVLNVLRDEGRVPGWRDEPYPAGPAFNAPSLFDMERAAVPLFGVRGYGVHLNGWLRDGGETFMWIGRRSLSKPTGPGLLDQMVGGGQPSGMSLRDNLTKECAEEAGMPATIAERAIPVGTVSYVTTRDEGLRHDVLFNFDLEVPADFTPVNTDGEVAEFLLLPIADVMQRLRDTRDFKFNSALVIIDFLVRHGFVDADDPDYADIVAGLHR